MKGYLALFCIDGVNPQKYVGIFSSPQAASNALNAQRGRENGIPKIIRYNCTYGCKEDEILIKPSHPTKAESHIYYLIINNNTISGVFQYAEHAKKRFEEERKYLGALQLQIWEGESLLMEYKIQKRWYE